MPSGSRGVGRFPSRLAYTKRFQMPSRDVTARTDRVKHDLSGKGFAGNYAIVTRFSDWHDACGGSGHTVGPEVTP